MTEINVKAVKQNKKINYTVEASIVNYRDEYDGDEERIEEAVEFCGGWDFILDYLESHSMFEGNASSSMGCDTLKVSFSENNN